MSLVRASFTVGSMTLLSRLFGFLRDMLIASVAGAGPLTDAFFVAFKIPNFLRRLFAEGAFNASFLPMFAGKLRTDGKAEAFTFAAQVMAILALSLTVLVILGIMFMPWLMLVLAPGFRSDPDTFDLAVTLTRITFPYILFISLVSLIGGVLNSFEKFAAVAATPILLNLGLIAGLLYASPFLPTPAHGLSYGVALAGVMQLGFIAWYARKHGMLPRFTRPRLTPDVKKLLLLMGPAAVGAGVAQINLLVDVMIASQFSGAVSYIYYADRIQQLPLGVIGIAIATASLPTLSKHVRAGEHAAAAESLNQALRLSLFLGLPAAFALLTLATPITAVIYQHGEFSAANTLAVAPALAAFAAGLPAFLLVKIFANAFFAAQDTKTPVKIAGLCICLNLSLNLLLMADYQHVGLALSTTIAGWVNALLLGFSLLRDRRFRPDRPFLQSLLRIILSTLVMVLVLLIVQRLLAGWLEGLSLLKALALCVLVTVGGVSYFAVVFVTGELKYLHLKRIVTKLSFASRK